jgi:hypothetical protein
MVNSCEKKISNLKQTKKNIFWTRTTVNAYQKKKYEKTEKKQMFWSKATIK